MKGNHNYHLLWRNNKQEIFKNFRKAVYVGLGSEDKKSNVIGNFPMLAEPKYNTVGTLGDYLTCSAITAVQSRIAKNLVLYSSFEIAAKELKQGRIDAFWVPGAYPGIGNFIMDKDLKVVDTCITPIPAIVLAGKTSVQPVGVQKVFLHQAVNKLLSEVNILFGEKVFVQSNPEASRQALKYPKTSVAITNSFCAEHYRLIIYSVLRNSILMPFVLFETIGTYDTIKI